MKAKLTKDRQRRELFSLYEPLRKKVKAQLKRELLEEEEKERLREKLHKFPKNSSRTRIKNRCVKTGRARSIYRLFKISRIELRRRGNAAQIPGLRRASW